MLEQYSMRFIGAAFFSLFLVVSPFQSLRADTAKQVCRGTGFKSCEERNRYRARRLEEWKDPKSLAFEMIQSCIVGQSALGHCPDASGSGAPLPETTAPMDSRCAVAKASLKDGFSDSDQRLSDQRLKDMKTGIMLSARKLVGIVQEKRKADVETMSQMMSDQGVASEMTPEDVKAAVSGFEMHVTAARIAYEKLNNSQYQNVYALDLEAFVRIQFDKAYKAPNGFKKTLENPALSPRNRFTLLMQRARETDEGTYADDLTPYHARMLLMFYFANKMKAKPAVMDEFASKLNLRFNADLTHVNWGNLVPHDGYLFGASAAHAVASTESSQPNKTGTGMDCSLLVQKSLETLGLKDNRFSDRLKTTQMNTDSNTRLCSEDQLVPGDVIVEEGHTFIFSGYKGNLKEAGKIQLQIIEAKGSTHRTLHETSFEIFGAKYEQGPEGCAKSKFTEENEKEQHSIWRDANEIIVRNYKKNFP